MKDKTRLAGRRAVETTMQDAMREALVAIKRCGVGRPNDAPIIMSPATYAFMRQWELSQWRENLLRALMRRCGP